MLKVSIITLFPDIFTAHLQHLPVKRAVEKGLLHVDLINLRNFAIDKRGTVDSPAYGGGPGMILRPEPIFNAITSVLTKEDTTIVFLTPRGSLYSQRSAETLSGINHLVIVCGRYEGIDQRVIDHFVRPKEPNYKIFAQEISIGNYVLSGGEIPAMAIIESVTRLLPGAIENTQALEQESFSRKDPGKTEYPQYSRPEDWMGLKVPEILISGNHGNIKKWKASN